MVVVHQNSTIVREYIDPIIKNEKNIEDSEKPEDSSKVISNILKIRVYKRRWLQLALFVLYSASNNVQCFQYTIITNITRRYYDVSALAVYWTSLIFMMTYIVLVFPASYLMGRVGLRWTVLIGSTGTFLGSWIKYYAISPDRFAIAFIGQAIIAMSQVVVLSLPGRLPAYWFGSKEVATATAISYFGTQTGLTICFLVTTMVVRNHEKIEDIGKDFASYLFAIAIACTITYVALIFFFKDEPRLPPSDTRALQKINQEATAESFWLPTKRILSNRKFLIFWNAYGITLSVMSILSTLMNPLYLAHFPNAEVDVGRMGVGATMMGAVGAAVSAFILDRTKKFRTIAISLCLLGLLGQISFYIAMMMEIKWIIFTTGIIFGTFLSGFLTVGVELCVEMTYPEPEQTSIGILNISNQIYSSVMILVAGHLIENYGDQTGHACMFVALVIGTVLCIINKIDLRRQNAVQLFGYDAVSLQVLQPQKTPETRKD